MSIDTIKAKHVSMHPQPIIGFAVNVNAYFLGVYVHDWGIRFMLIGWHICWFWQGVPA